MAAFSWKRGLKHAVLPFLLVIVAAGVVVVVRPPKNPEKFGEGTGQFAFVIGALAFGASYLAQTGRRAAALVVAVATFGLLFAITSVVVFGWTNHPKLDPRDRVPLVEYSDNGERWLRHPTLGFALRHPGEGFKEAPQFAGLMARGAGSDDTLYYAYADAEPSAILMVGIAPEGADSAEDLGKTVDGIERGMRDSAAKQTPDAKLEVIERTISWDSGRDARLHIALAGAHMRLHVFARKRPDGTPYIVILGAMSKSADALEREIAELRP